MAVEEEETDFLNARLGETGLEASLQSRLRVQSWHQGLRWRHLRVLEERTKEALD